MVSICLPTFPRFPLRKKKHKSYFDKNRTHDFHTRLLLIAGVRGYLEEDHTRATAVYYSSVIVVRSENSEDREDEVGRFDPRIVYGVSTL